MGKKLFCFVIFIGLACPSFAQEFTISGYIKNGTTGEVLIGANIYNFNQGNGTSTNTYGFFSYTTSRDSVDLLISYVGYQSKHIRFYLKEDTTLNIGLSQGEELDEIVVTADRRIEEVTQMSAVSVPIRQIKAMPQILGEVDILKALQMIPGVQSGTEGTSGLYVRGGGPDQNLILLDGVPVYNASHLFGFVSVFNADAVNNVKLIKGGFPARYGGRLSSVVDITLKEGNTEELKGAGAVGLLSSKITLDGPLSDKTTFLISGRRTYIDILARPLIKSQTDGEGVAGYYFYDLNAKINHKFSNKNRVYLSGYFGKDKAYQRTNREGYKDEFGLQWGNITTAFRWNHVYNPKLFSNLTLTYSRYQFEVFENQLNKYIAYGETVTDESSRRYFSGIYDFAARADFDFIPSPRHSIKFGGTAIRHRFNPGAYAFTAARQPDIEPEKNQTYATEFFVYAEDDFELTGKLKFNVGVHFSGFSVDNMLYTSVQPRIAFNYLLPNRIALKGSYTRMTQYIHLLTNSGIGLPTDLWVPATSRIKPQQARQVALGLAKTVEGFEISLEGYYKKMHNLIVYKDGATYLEMQGDWQDKVTSGDGESYGAELFIQKKFGKWSGWLGYTLAWNNRQFDAVNFGEPFPFKYDRRHDINLVLSYSPHKGLQYSLGWVYGTGNAVTLPTHRYPKAGSKPHEAFRAIKYYKGRNGYRMPAYHRLDLSVSWTKQKSWGERTWTIGVYNAYSRRNPFYIDIESRKGEKHFIQYSLFPIIPSVTYSFKF